MTSLKKLIWIGRSRLDLSEMPEEVQDEIGYGLYQAQRGLFPDAAKPLKGLRGVIEIVCDYDKNTFRAVYAVKLGDEIYVLHAFQKKSKAGIQTPKTDLELIYQRLKSAMRIERGKK